MTNLPNLSISSKSKLQAEDSNRKEVFGSLETADSVKDTAYYERRMNNVWIGAQGTHVVHPTAGLDYLQIYDFIKKLISKDPRYHLVESIRFETDTGLVGFVNEIYAPGCQCIFIVVNPGDHWMLIIVDLVTNRSILLDSAYYEHTYEGYLQRTFKLIQLLQKRDPNLTLDASLHKFCLVTDQPKQAPDSRDCGTYVGLSVEYKLNKSMKSLFGLSSEQKRLRINRTLDTNIVTSPGRTKRVTRSQKAVTVKQLQELASIEIKSFFEIYLDEI